jgi:uncharacterized cupin superfamily protein
MLTGEVLYRHGDQSYHLTPGDALLFDSAAPHGPEVTKRPNFPHKRTKAEHQAAW